MPARQAANSSQHSKQGIWVPIKGVEVPRHQTAIRNTAVFMSPARGVEGICSAAAGVGACCRLGRDLSAEASGCGDCCNTGCRAGDAAVVCCLPSRGCWVGGGAAAAGEPPRGPAALADAVVAAAAPGCLPPGVAARCPEGEAGSLCTPCPGLDAVSAASTALALAWGAGAVEAPPLPLLHSRTSPSSSDEESRSMGSPDVPRCCSCRGCSGACCGAKGVGGSGDTGGASCTTLVSGRVLGAIVAPPGLPACGMLPAAAAPAAAAAAGDATAAAGGSRASGAVARAMVGHWVSSQGAHAAG